MSLKRPVTLAQARRWPAAAARRESFCARMGGMREQLTSARTARDPRSRINRALAAWDCDVPELLDRKHVSKGIRPMKITSKMVGAETRKATKRSTRKTAGPKRNPGDAPMRRTGGPSPIFKFALIPDDGGFAYGMDDRTPVLVVFGTRDRQKGIYRSFAIPAAAVKNPEFQSWVRSQRANSAILSISQLRAIVRGFMG